MTGFTAKTRALITERDGGCVICGWQSGMNQIHHRAPRQMGGSKAAWVNYPSNGISLCVSCHRLVERERSWAESQGYIVRRGIHPPSSIPLVHARWGVVVLTDEGEIEWPE